jgi:hypothetical protein
LLIQWGFFLIAEGDKLVANYAEILGAAERVAGERFTIYLPDHDKSGNLVPEISTWVEAAMALLTEANGGATQLAPTVGQWRSDTGQIVTEQTILIYSYLRDAEAFGAKLPDIADFLHLFGRETQQGEVVAELFGESPEGFVSRFYSITDFR